MAKKPSKKFSVLLMRDDSDVRSYRINLTWIKVALGIVLGIICVAVVGIGVSWHFWDKAHLLAEGNRELGRRLDEAGVLLERLENVDKIGRAEGSSPQTLIAEAKRTAERDKEILRSASANNNYNASVADKNMTSSGTTQPDPSTIAKNPAQTAVLTEAQSQNQTVAQDEFPTVDLGVIKINNLSIKIEGEESVNMSFDLLNTGRARSVTGRVSIEAITNDRQIVALEMKKGGSDLDFQIQKYKRVEIVFSMPEGFKLGDVYRLRFNVVTSDSSKVSKVVFSNVYQMPGSTS